MGKKKKGKKKGKKGKKKKAEAEVVENPRHNEYKEKETGKWLPKEQRDALFAKEQADRARLAVDLAKERHRRNYVQLERDTIQTYFDITRKEVADLDIKIKAKDREMEVLEENHRVEVRVYVQKVKHLEYEHKNTLKKVTRDGEIAVEDERDEHNKVEAGLKRAKKSLKLSIKEKELANEMQIAEWKDKHSKNLSKLREEFGKNLAALEEKYQQKLRKLKADLQLRHKVEVHEIEERKNLHINDLMKNHEAAFGEIKDYYNDITHDNLTLIRKLKNEVTEMKNKRQTNQKMMTEIAQENKQLLDPLQVAVKQVEDLRRDLKDYEKDKLSLKNAKSRLVLLKARFERVGGEHKKLEDKFSAVESERDRLLETFEATVKEVQRKAEYKNLQLGQKAEEIDTQLAERHAQMDEVASAARLDPSVVQAVGSKLDRVIDQRNAMIDDLQYEVARVSKAYNDTVRTMDSKLQEFGIPPSEVGLQPVPTETSTMPAGLVAAR